MDTNTETTHKLRRPPLTAYVPPHSPLSVEGEYEQKDGKVNLSFISRQCLRWDKDQERQHTEQCNLAKWPEGFLRRQGKKQTEVWDEEIP